MVVRLFHSPDDAHLDRFQVSVICECVFFSYFSLHTYEFILAYGQEWNCWVVCVNTVIS